MTSAVMHDLAPLARNFNESIVDQKAQIYFDRYRQFLEAYEGAAGRNRNVGSHELVAMGQMLDQYFNYQNYCESIQNVGALGTIPQVAAEVVTASVATSIIPLLCSIQPMREEHDIVYYKQVVAQQNQGGYTANQVISDPLTRDQPGNGELGSQRQEYTSGTTTSGTTTYTGTLDDLSSGAPIRPYNIFVNVGNLGFGQDNGNGRILGAGLDGTINYQTRAFSITLSADPAAADADIEWTYDLDLDSADSIPKIQSRLTTKDIRAEVFALASDTGHMANFNFQNRFGRTAVDETAQDLSTEITRLLNTNIVSRIVLGANSRATSDAANNLVTWNSNPPSGVSYAEHKLTFIDAVSNAESNLHNLSGSNSINRYIGGRKAVARLRGMPGFVGAPDAAEVSIGLVGTYDGVPVIRATGVIDDDRLYPISNPQGYFNAPLAYSPYMPLFITNTIQSPNNPFQGTTAAAVWSGITPLNDNLVTRIDLTDLDLNP